MFWWPNHQYNSNIPLANSKKSSSTPLFSLAEDNKCFAPTDLAYLKKNSFTQIYFQIFKTKLFYLRLSLSTVYMSVFFKINFIS